MSDDALERLRQRQSKEKPLVQSRTLDVQISSNLEIEESEIKSMTVRLNAEIGERILSFCRKHKISRETLIESLFLDFEEGENKERVLREAKRRADARKESALKKRAKTWSEKL